MAQKTRSWRYWDHVLTTSLTFCETMRNFGSQSGRTGKCTWVSLACWRLKCWRSGFQRHRVVALFMKKNPMFICVSEQRPAFTTSDKLVRWWQWTNYGLYILSPIQSVRWYPPYTQYVSQIIIRQSCTRNRLSILLVQLHELHLRLHFGIADKLGVLQLLRAPSIDILAKGIFPMEQRVVPIQTHLVAIVVA